MIGSGRGRDLASRDHRADMHSWENATKGRKVSSRCRKLERLDGFDGVVFVMKEVGR